MTTQLARILITDDHALVRAGYRRLLLSEANFSIVEAGDGEDALTYLQQAHVDLVLLDIHLPGRLNGLETLREIRAQFPKVRVLVMSGLPINMYARHVMRAGASGYISKSGEPDEVIKAVRAILRDRRYVPEELAEMLANDLQRDQSLDPHGSLSRRELEVLNQLASGARLTVIAQRLGLHVKSVSTYRRRLLDKMSLHSNAELITYMFRNKLVPTTQQPEESGDESSIRPDSTAESIGAD